MMCGRRQLMMRSRAGLTLAAGLIAGLALLAEQAMAQGRAGDLPEDQPAAAGNWSRSQTPAQVRSAAPSGTATGSSENQQTGSGVPVPRPKPGSKAAERDKAERQKKVVIGSPPADAGQAAAEDEAAAPLPKAKPANKQDKPVQAGLAPAAEDGVEVPYRGDLEKDEIKSVLTGKVVASRIDGEDARITLGEDGKLTWTAGTAGGAGFWWTEKGRICDRYDPSGDFPGRGAGCRSFEQRADGYYAGGRRLQFLN
jgi:hypothetical protein